MVFSPFRSAISHAPRAKPTADDRFDITHRPPGSRLPHPDAKVNAPINQPTITVSGCSPQWYALPADTQGDKILPGF